MPNQEEVRKESNSWIMWFENIHDENFSNSFKIAEIGSKEWKPEDFFDNEKNIFHNNCNHIFSCIFFNVCLVHNRF